MAYYLIRARPKREHLEDLRGQLDRGEIIHMRPFGKALNHSLQNARLQDDGFAVWEEEDYCRPPLAMEREAVLDHYFSDLSVERVEEGAGWAKVGHLPRLWQEA